jgi:trehalose 6-phosphate phosphatase
MSEDLLQPFHRSPESAGVFLDFDGTLSEIVHHPQDARPVEGARDLLSALGRRLKVVAIVSGRAAADLVGWLGPDVEIWGTHGAERAVNGSIEIAEHLRPHIELMARVKDEADAAMRSLGDSGIYLEDKTVMLGLHFRAAADVEAARRSLHSIAMELAERHGLTIAGGRLAYELRPPVDLSKAAVVLERSRAESLSAVAFAGDDRVDLPGFDALDALGEEGVSTLRVAVSSDEAPPALLERADVVVEGPIGAVEFLQRLLPE